VWKGSTAARIVLGVFCAAITVGATCAAGAYVHVRNGEYLLSNPGKSPRPDQTLPPAEGKALLERLLNPAHMAVSGFGEAGNATLRAGDDTREALFGLLGPAKRLPDWRRCAHDFGYVSSRPGDSTVVVVRMANPCLENIDHVSAFLVCFSPTVLPKEYRPYLKRFVPSAGVHAGLATQSGLKLSLTRPEVEAVLGQPLWKEKDFYSYGAVGNIQFTPEFLTTRWHWPKDVQSRPGSDARTIDIWFVGGRVCAFFVSKIYDL
jgi:hypothetical protein